MSTDEPWSVERHLDAQVGWETETGDAEDYLAIFEALNQSRMFDPQLSASPRMDKQHLTEPQVRARKESRRGRGQKYDLTNVSGVDAELTVGNPAIDGYTGEVDHDAPILAGALQILEMEDPEGEMRDFKEFGRTLNRVANDKASEVVDDNWDRTGYVQFEPNSNVPVKFEIPSEGITEEGNYGVASSTVQIMGNYARLHRDAVISLEEQLLDNDQELNYDSESNGYRLEDV